MSRLLMFALLLAVAHGAVPVPDDCGPDCDEGEGGVPCRLCSSVCCRLTPGLTRDAASVPALAAAARLGPPTALAARDAAAREIFHVPRSCPA